ncbi:unnamed protein product [Oppiella nova]|uniref:non-specific serine/threonine protein kinase n=1 Tax=Oppiella nova TaxID=334625 RepID=A0A7R9LSS2_9ACAR|nr:unnamed protein product [Oppiella nova]CAG2166624.1 unnamed protein product [Oppiella nova]
MELCSDSLQDILEHKPQVFGRQPGEPMNSIEFYISCHIFKELLECVQYLHELNPSVIHRDLKPDNILIARKVTLDWHHCTQIPLEIIPQEWKLYNTWHRNSSELSIYSGYEIYDKFIKLDQVIDSMTAIILSNRPECSQYGGIGIGLNNVISEVSDYKRLYEELHSLGSGAFGESEYCVQYISQWYDDNMYYICMELCSDSLQNILEHKPQVFGRQPEEPMNSIEFYISCHIFKELLECVQYLHELNPPVIHRDLHSGNILLARNVRNGRFFKVADFGSATIRKSISTLSNPTREPPDLRWGESNEPKSDVYTLAITTGEIFGFDLENLMGSVIHYK